MVSDICENNELRGISPAERNRQVFRHLFGPSPPPDIQLSCRITKRVGGCREIRKGHQALWTFEHHAEMEPTKNVAERAVRLGVLWQKGRGGSRVMMAPAVWKLPCPSW